MIRPVAKRQTYQGWIDHLVGGDNVIAAFVVPGHQVFSVEMLVFAITNREDYMYIRQDSAEVFRMHTGQTEVGAGDKVTAISLHEQLLLSGSVEIGINSTLGAAGRTGSFYGRFLGV